MNMRHWKRPQRYLHLCYNQYNMRDAVQKKYDKFRLWPRILHDPGQTHTYHIHTLYSVCVDEVLWGDTYFTRHTDTDLWSLAPSLAAWDIVLSPCQTIVYYIASRCHQVTCFHQIPINVIYNTTKGVAEDCWMIDLRGRPPGTLTRSNTVIFVIVSNKLYQTYNIRGDVAEGWIAKKKELKLHLICPYAPYWICKMQMIRNIRLEIWILPVDISDV